MSRKYLTVLASFLLVVPLAAFGQASDSTKADSTPSARVATASASTTPTPHMKSPLAAGLISVVVPGGGQMYAGKGRKGGILLGLFVIGAGTTVVLFASDFTRCFMNLNQSNCSGADFIIPGAVTLGVWGYSIFSAPGDAREYNENHRKLALRIQPIIQLGSTGKFTHSPNKFGLRVGL